MTNPSMVEVYQEQPVRELLAAFSEKTIREALSTATANAAIPTLVSAKALHYLQTFPGIHAEDYALEQEMPPGTGLTYKFQIFSAMDYQSWGSGGTQQDGTPCTPADPTLTAPTVAVMNYGQATRISDLLQGATVFSFVEEVSRAHGEAIRKAINYLLWTQLKSATDNKVTGGASGDGTVYSPTLANIATCKKYVMLDKFLPNYLVSGVTAWDALLMANWTNTQFSGALIQWIKDGSIQQLLGLDIVIDPLYNATEPNGTNGEYYMSLGVRGLSIGWAHRGGVESEIQREALAIAQDIVTHITGGAALLIDKSTGHIIHAGT